MSRVTAEHLLAGIIFGDLDNNEFIYLPGGEVGSEHPLCVYEHADRREDLPLAEAARLVQHLTLKPVSHPIWGKRSY